MKYKTGIMGIFLTIVLLSGIAAFNACKKESPDQLAEMSGGAPTQDYTGSQSCQECHERFYQLWATSHHGLAMQPYTETLAADKLTPHTQEITIGSYHYRAEI